MFFSMSEEKKTRSGAAGGVFANLKGRCEVLGAIRKAVLSPVLPTVRAPNPPRGRGAAFKCRTRFASFAAPTPVHCQLLRCWVPGICYNIHHLRCAHVQPALLIPLRAHPPRMRGSSSSPSHCTLFAFKSPFLALTPV